MERHHQLRTNGACGFRFPLNRKRPSICLNSMMKVTRCMSDSKLE
jgi:hypothetical protein